MKAQAAMEFMVFFGFFALAFLLISSTLIPGEMASVDKQRGELAKETAISLRDEIDSARSMGDGYWRVLEPRSSAEQKFVVRIKSGMVNVRVDNTEYAAALVAGRVEGLPADSDGMTVDMERELRIRNENGVVVLEQ